MKKNKKYLLLWLVFCLCLIFPLSANAIKPRKPKTPPRPKGLLPEKDTFVDSAYPETNFGKENKLITAFTVSSEIIFLKFDLSSLPEFYPEDKIFLSLELEQSNESLEPIEIELLLPSTDWDENELTWYNKPALYSSGLTTFLEATPGAQKIDLKPLVEQWQSNAIENNGLAFYYNFESFRRQYGSKENEKHPPLLVVENLRPEPTPEPTPTPESEVKEIAQNLFAQVKSATIAAENKPEAKISSRKLFKGRSPWPEFLIQLFYQNITGITLLTSVILVFAVDKLLEKKFT